MSQVKKSNSPFTSRFNYVGQKDFDKYYLDVTEKEVFKASGEVDPETGEALGVIEKKLIIKKIDIDEFLQSQADSVGVDAYIRALALQGETLDDFSTQVDDKVNDFSSMPDTLAEVLTSGDKARKIFENLDPAIKGSHTTIEGFLNSLSQESIDSYIKGRIEALTTKKEGD